MLDINKTKNIWLLYIMIKIRRFEEKIGQLYPQRKIQTPIHLCIGQEAVAAGVCAHLNREDYIYSTHRNHGHCIAKGMDIRYLTAELYGKATGCSKGKGGSMHITSFEDGIAGTSAIVAGSIPLAVGSALAFKMRKEARVSVAFFGDGAVDEGTFCESLNFASLKKLPVIFVCENNFYAVNSHQKIRHANPDIAAVARHYNMAGVQIDGNDVLSVYDKMEQAVKRANAGDGPTLIECITYRWRCHVGPEYDYEKGCRPEEELQEWLEKCPIDFYKKLLLKKQLISEQEVSEMEAHINNEIEDSLEFTKASRFPDISQLYEDVYYRGNKN
ncbi:MAG: thiamine pyrophosphate-dependent dehydrogenase E1 component subunit alpha [Nitrospirae bacterium YQR-1]